MHDLYKKHRATQDLSPRTLKTENAALRDHIIPAIGSWVVQRCSLRDFQDLRLDWHDQYVATDRYSSASVNKWIRILKIYVGWCSRRLGVAHSARDLKRLPKPKKRKGRAMSRDEVEALLVEVKTQYPHYYGIVYVLAYTGQRFSTISALKWSDIDTQNGLIHFRESKTGHKASAPLERFETVLREHKAVLKEWSPIAFNKAPYVFPCQGPQPHRRRRFCCGTSPYQ